LIQVVTEYHPGQFAPPALVTLTVIPVTVAPLGKPENEYVAVGVELSNPEAVTEPEVAEAVCVSEVADVVPESVVLEPLQMVTSEPALTVGTAKPVPAAVTFTLVALAL
jgi:hypothetical protein